MEDDPGYYEPVFYEPTGRYVMQTGSGLSPGDEEFLMKFLEPQMVKLQVNVTEGDKHEDLTFTNEEKLKEYTDAMHEMEFTLTDENPVAILDSSRIVQLSFTAENEVVHDYYFTAEGFMVHEDKVYAMGQTDITFPLTNKPVNDDNLPMEAF